MNENKCFERVILSENFLEKVNDEISKSYCNLKDLFIQEEAADNTGLKFLDITNVLKQSVRNEFQEKLEGGHIRHAQYMELSKPFSIHNDVGASLDRDNFLKPYKVITFSLENNLETSGVVFFNQLSNKSVLLGEGYFDNYDIILTTQDKKLSIENFDTGHLIDKKYKTYLGHVSEEDLKGLSIACVAFHEPKSALIFSCNRLHASMNFPKEHTRKIVSIFVDRVSGV